MLSSSSTSFAMAALTSALSVIEAISASPWLRICAIAVSTSCRFCASVMPVVEVELYALILLSATTAIVLASTEITSIPTPTVAVEPVPPTVSPPAYPVAPTSFLACRSMFPSVAFSRASSSTDTIELLRPAIIFSMPVTPDLSATPAVYIMLRWAYSLPESMATLRPDSSAFFPITTRLSPRIFW